MTSAGWTIETLYEHFNKLFAEKDLRDDQRFKAQEKAVESALKAQQDSVSAALNSADRAVQKSEAAYNDRFNSVNEFRGQISDQTKEFPSKVVVDAQVSALQLQLNALTSRMDRREGSGSGLHTGWIVGTGALGLLLLSGGFIMTVATYLKH